MNQIVYLVPIMGLVGLAYTFWKFNWVSKQETGDENMTRLSGYIADGAIAFLKAEWKVLAMFAFPTAILLFWLGSNEGTAEHPIHSSPLIAVAFLIGAFFSALAGYIGMKVATKANVRTAQAARTSLAKALNVSFTGGSVMGMGVAGLAILGLGGLFILFYNYFAPGLPLNSIEMKKAIEVLAGFSLGAESIALFARVGGGIYTKAADVGADLVGKVEAGIPEDDVRNPATIADNVGDNVGDVAGMGADLFGSYVATILATMVLGQEISVTDHVGGYSPVLLPMLIAGVGLLASIVSTFFVRIKGETSSVQNALNIGNWASIAITLVACFFLTNHLLPADGMVLRGGTAFGAMDVFYAIVVGLVVGTLMSMITEYYTAMGKRPVLSIIEKSGTGHATNIIGGLAVGMESTVLPILTLAAGIIFSYKFAGLYGVSIAAAGMMATTAMQLAIDAFGPIADNAGGIAEMSQLPAEVRERTDNLDAVGNTTAATGKGFAIASAALTSLALLAAFVGIAGISHIDIYKAPVLAGLFVGGMIPFIFSALCISAVGSAAMEMVNEVRRQFREIPGIMEYKAQPEYDKCVAISTEASIKQMILPGAIALITPVLVGFTMGPEVLGGLLAGVTVSGVLMGIFQSNAGGAWDNAKKSFEKGVMIDGQMYYKKSDPHKASVTGDTVGDPFKDTSGPSMNILIKLMSIVSLVIAPYIIGITTDTVANDMERGFNDGQKAGLAMTTDVKINKTVEDGVETTTKSSLSADMANGAKLNLEGIGEMETKLVDFINSKNSVDKNTWFDFDNLLFETGKSTLKAESAVQLGNIAKVLEVCPAVNLKIGGYTDNTGNADANLKLSADRAKMVEAELIKLGVADDRLDAEGYGDQYPVANNTTDEGRAKNRRISVRVTKK
jgi:K(+)-stimulated pyrophosphate-energized sodium pump